MTNAYCDLATLKSGGALNIAGSVHDRRLLSLLEQASRWIDGYCNRHFYVLHATRRFDGKGRKQLETPDLISLASLQTRARSSAAPVAWSPETYRLYSLNAAPMQPGGHPYTHLLVNPDSPAQYRFPAGPASVEIVGKWGFCEIKAASGTTILADAAVGVADDRLLATPTGKLSAGQTLALGAEQLYVTAVDGEEVTALREVNGTAAAQHPAGAAIALYRYPGPVVEACLQLASQLWSCRDRPVVPAGRSSLAGNPASYPGPEVAGLLAAYRKLPVGPAT